MAISENSANLMPSEALTSMSNFQTAALDAEQSLLSTLQTREARLSRQVSYTNTVNGRQTTELTERKSTENQMADTAKGAASTASLAQTLSEGGQEPYEEGSLAPGTTSDAASIEEMNSDIDSMFEDIELDDIMMVAQLALLGVQIADSRQKVDAIQADLNTTNDVLEKRASGELPEPVLNTEALEAALSNILDELSVNLSEEERANLESSMNNSMSQSMEAFETFVEKALVEPYNENRNRINAIKAQILKYTESEEEQPLFDLVYAPPKATKDQFVLSQDGIYYDSRDGGIPGIFTKKITSDYWKLKFGPNKGGKGIKYSEEE